jgi:hypothetical protein
VSSDTPSADATPIGDTVGDAASLSFPRSLARAARAGIGEGADVVAANAQESDRREDPARSTLAACISDTQVLRLVEQRSGLTSGKVDR